MASGRERENERNMSQWQWRPTMSTSDRKLFTGLLASGRCRADRQVAQIAEIKTFFLQ